VSHDPLEVLLGADRVSTAPDDLAAHARDAFYPDELRPDVVVFAQSAADVQAVLAHAHETGRPVVPYAVGSSLEGSALARFGGISLDLTRMDRILEVRPADLLAVVGPGVTHERLNAELEPHGVFFAVDPGADASLGGMAATAASGTMAVRYGTMRENVLALQVALASGELIRTGTRAPKSASGYNLTPLLVGSEGTLGVFTELTVRLAGRPSAVLAATAAFASVDDAVAAAVTVIGEGVPVARIELLDTASLRVVNSSKGLSVTEAPTLFLEFHGQQAAIAEEAAATERICMAHGASEFARAAAEQERERLWEARHHLAYAALAAHAGERATTTDVAVPISELPGAVTRSRELLDEHGLDGYVLGHVGDGNFHVLVMSDPDDGDAQRAADAVNDGIVTHALSVGGTATGEHGVGIRKQRFMRAEHGASLDVMRAIKHALDPRGILNPGKLVDPEPVTAVK
jgi:D-lactate dehydrogenase (cytochrome)